MRSLVLCVCVGLLGLAFAADPTPPAWPLHYSTSLTITRTGSSNPPMFWRLFDDYGLQLGRADGLLHWEGEDFFTTVFFNHPTQVETVIFWTEGAVTCFNRSLTKIMPTPNTQNLTYIGKAIQFFEPVYQWFGEDTNHTHFLSYYTQQDAPYNPVRADFHNKGSGTSDIFLFTEFDQSRQPSYIYQIPTVIQPLCGAMPTSFVEAFEAHPVQNWLKFHRNGGRLF